MRFLPVVPYGIVGSKIGEVMVQILKSFLDNFRVGEVTIIRFSTLGHVRGGYICTM